MISDTLRLTLQCCDGGGNKLCCSRHILAVAPGTTSTYCSSAVWTCLEYSQRSRYLGCVPYTIIFIFGGPIRESHEILNAAIDPPWNPHGSPMGIPWKPDDGMSTGNESRGSPTRSHGPAQPIMVRESPMETPYLVRHFIGIPCQSHGGTLIPWEAPRVVGVPWGSHGSTSNPW